MIIWNQVTWYSKLAAIIFFLCVLPILAFYIGVQYQDSVTVTQPVENIVPTKPVVVSKDNLECHYFPKYFVVSKDNSDEVGSSILVKDKKDNEEKPVCEYVVESTDFEVKDTDAEYFMAIEGDFLIDDSGTSVGLRGLHVYSLISKKEVFKDTYFNPIEIKDGKINYWKNSDEVATKSNCPEYNEYLGYGGGVAIEYKTQLNLTDLTQKNLGQKKCSYRE